MLAVVDKLSSPISGIAAIASACRHSLGALPQLIFV
jgi:hypothetical protein